MAPSELLIERVDRHASGPALWRAPVGDSNGDNVTSLIVVTGVVWLAEDCEQRRFGDLDRQEVDSENLGNFFVSHRTEEVHLGCLGLLWVDRRKAVQSLVNLEEPPRNTSWF